MNTEKDVDYDAELDAIDSEDDGEPGTDKAVGELVDSHHLSAPVTAKLDVPEE